MSTNIWRFSNIKTVSTSSSWLHVAGEFLTLSPSINILSKMLPMTALLFSEGYSYPLNWGAGREMGKKILILWGLSMSWYPSGLYYWKSGVAPFKSVGKYHDKQQKRVIRWKLNSSALNAMSSLLFLLRQTLGIKNPLISELLRYRDRKKPWAVWMWH